MNEAEFKRQYRIARLLDFRASHALRPDFNDQLLSLVDSRVATCFQQRNIVEGFRNRKGEWVSWYSMRFLNRYRWRVANDLRCR